ncbi:hypothetical protein LINPERPRIM_LOCUS42660 [Linum perenne]
MAMCSEGRANLGFMRRDLANNVQAFRRTPMPDSGEKFLHEWFTEESSRNPAFYHRLQYDTDNKIESIFWADARMILDIFPLVMELLSISHRGLTINIVPLVCFLFP